MHDIELRNCEEIYFYSVGNLSFKEGKNSVGLPGLILEFWWRHVKTKNSGQMAFCTNWSHGTKSTILDGKRM